MILGTEFVRVRALAMGAPYRTLLAEARATYRDLDQISSETGIDSLIEIHDWSICPRPVPCACRRPRPNVGAIFDAGNFVSEGYESLMAVDILGPFLRHVHVKTKRW